MVVVSFSFMIDNRWQVMTIYTKLSNGQKYNETTTTDKVSDLEQVYFLKNVFSETTGPLECNFPTITGV